MDQRDTRWIGAWWIGFVLCAAATLLWAIPLSMFPSRIAGTEKVKKEDKNLLNNTKG